MDAIREKSSAMVLEPSPTTITASVSIQGSVVEYKVHNRKSVAPAGKRSSIKDFSPGARLRMLKTFQKINFVDHPEPLFMTLTYPDELALPDLAKRNIHRKVMARHLERLTGAAIPAAWRVEWMPRQTGSIIGTIAPHWHWLIFKHRFIDFRDINAAWKKTIGYNGTVITDIRAVDQYSCIHMYMAKYISKEAVSCSLVIAAYQNRIGRQYGWLRKGEIPMCTEHRQGRLSRADRDALTSMASERLPWVSEGQEQSFTLFGDAAEDARKILTGETLDERTTDSVQS